MARATKFRIGHAIKHNSIIKIDDKVYSDTSKNYSNGKGGFWPDEENIKKLLTLLKNITKLQHGNRTLLQGIIASLYH